MGFQTCSISDNLFFRAGKNKIVSLGTKTMNRAQDRLQLIFTAQLFCEEILRNKEDSFFSKLRNLNWTEKCVISICSERSKLARELKPRSLDKMKTCNARENH